MQGSAMTVRLALKNDLERVNILRKQVNDIHVDSKPEVFKAGFSDELSDYVYTVWSDPEQDIVVGEVSGEICGFAVLKRVCYPENPFMYEREFLSVEEFCVDSAYRRTGVATEMIRFIKDYANKKGLIRIELSVWEFNQDAVAFYEKAGFATYQRRMEMFI